MFLRLTFTCCIRLWLISKVFFLSIIYILNINRINQNYKLIKQILRNKFECESEPPRKACCICKSNDIIRFKLILKNVNLALNIQTFNINFCYLNYYNARRTNAQTKRKRSKKASVKQTTLHSLEATNLC